MHLIIEKLTTGKYKAYFDRLPNFYGMGDTQEEAIQQLKDKTNAVLAMIGKIQEDK